MTAVNAQSCQYCYIDVDVDNHRANLALVSMPYCNRKMIHMICHFFLIYVSLQRCLMPSAGPDQCAYYHALFVRDKPELIGQMTPK